MKSIVTIQIILFIFFSLISVVILKKMRFNTFPEEIIVNKPFTPEVISKTCLLKPDPGPCRANVKMYFFDPRQGVCNTTFSWGGCQGNGNRFDTVQECEDKCLSKNTTTKIRPRYCFLSFDYGFCFGAATRYYYNHIWKTCHETIYSGCGGNKNNFYSMEQCEAICRFGRGRLTEDPRWKSGQTRKILIINPPNTTVRGRQQVQNQTTATEITASTTAVSRVYIPYRPTGQGIVGLFKRK